MGIFSIFLPETFWVFVTAIATIALAYIAQTQLKAILEESRKNNKVISATFLNEFKKSFFTEQERILVLLLENNWLKFEEKEKYFVNSAPESFKKKFNEISFLQRNYYLTQEIDDFLLQHFEDAALLKNKEVIELPDAEQNFEYYLSTTFENKEIKRYIEWAQKDDTDIYRRMEELYHELKNAGSTN